MRVREKVVIFDHSRVFPFFASPEFEIGGGEDDGGGAVTGDASAVVEAPEVFAGAEEFAFGTEAEEEGLVLVEVEGESEFDPGGAVEFGVLEFVGAESVLVTGPPVPGAVFEVVDEAGFGESGKCGEVDVGGSVGVEFRVEGVSVSGFSTFEGFCFREPVAAEGEGVERELGMDFELCFPDVAFFFGRGTFPKAGDAVGIVAVVNFDFFQAILPGRGDGETGGVVFDFEGRWRGDGDVFVFSGEVLFEPLVEHDPLLGAGSVVGVHVPGDPPVVVREAVHGSVDAMEMGVEVVRGGDEHDGDVDVLPVGGGVDGVLVEGDVLDVADDVAAGHAVVFFVAESAAANEGSDGFEPWIDGGHGGDGAAHGVAGEAEFGGIDFGLLFEEGEGASSGEGEHEPIRVAWAHDGVDAEFVWLEVAFEMLAEGFGVEVGALGGVDFSPVGSPFVIGIEFGFEGAAEPVDIDGGESLGGKVVAALAVGALSSAVAPDEGWIFFAIVREAVVGGKAGVGALEGADFKSNEAGDDAVFFPLVADFDVEWFGSGVVVFPESGGALGDLFCFCVGYQGNFSGGGGFFPRERKSGEGGDECEAREKVGCRFVHDLHTWAALKYFSPF